MINSTRNKQTNNPGTPSPAPSTPSASTSWSRGSALNLWINIYFGWNPAWEWKSSQLPDEIQHGKMQVPSQASLHWRSACLLPWHGGNGNYKVRLLATQFNLISRCDFDQHRFRHHDHSHHQVKVGCASLLLVCRHYVTNHALHLPHSTYFQKAK